MLRTFLPASAVLSARAVSAEVTPSARVIGLELESSVVRAGQIVPVTLLWQAVEHTPLDLQSGLRLVPLDGGRQLTERWGRPNRERTPTGKWLVGEIDRSTATWRLLANPSVMGRTWSPDLPDDVRPGLTKVKLLNEGGDGPDFDQWDGYPVEREAFLDHIADNEEYSPTVMKLCNISCLVFCIPGAYCQVRSVYHTYKGHQRYLESQKVAYHGH